MDFPFLTDRLAIAVGNGFYSAGLLYGIWSLTFRHRYSRLASYGLIALGWILQTYGLFLRGHVTHSCPVGNKFEVVQFVAWSCTLLYLFVGPAFRMSLLGFFTAGLATLLGTLSLLLTGWDSAVRDRPFGADPAVAIHASLALFSYGVFALLALTSLMYLLQHRNLRRKQLGGPFALLPSIVDLDQINLRLLGVGVALLTLALGIAATHVHLHPTTVAHTKLVGTVAVWLCYLVLLAQRLRQRWVALRFARLGLVLFLAPVLTLWIVHSPRRTTPAAEQNQPATTP